MNRAQLATLLTAASRVTRDDAALVMGSQAILGSFDEEELPSPATASMEADIAYLVDPGNEKSDRVEAVLGELSDFHHEHGFYAEGVRHEVAVLPSGWRDRLIESDGSQGLPRGALFLEPHDLALSKLVAHREKDLEFVAALIDAGLLEAGVLRERVSLLPDDHSDRLAGRLRRWLDHWPDEREGLDQVLDEGLPRYSDAVRRLGE